MITLGVKLIYGLDIDTMPEKNGCDTLIRFFAPALVKVRFVDEKTGRIIFSYAPKFEDEKPLTEAFALIREYDVKRKEFGEFMKERMIKEHVKGVVKQ